MSFSYHLKELSKEYDMLNTKYEEFKKTANETLPTIQKFPVIPKSIEDFLNKYQNIKNLSLIHI